LTSWPPKPHSDSPDASGWLYAAIITTSHILCMGTGSYVMVLYWQPIHVVCFFMSLPLFYMRQMYMVKEVRWGAPSSSFGDFRERNIEGNQRPNEKHNTGKMPGKVS